MITVHNVLPHEKSTAFDIVSKTLFRFADHFIVHTQINKKQLMQHYGLPEKRISVIPHGTLDHHVKPPVGANTMRRRFDISADDKVILMFGAIRPYKGLDTAIKAFARVKKSVPNAKLLIAGKLWEKWEPYEYLIGTLGIGDDILCHLDYIPAGDVHRFFSAADLVILPYHHFDSQSGVGSSAIAFRKPMIVSRTGGLPDLVRDKECIVAPGNPFELAEAIIRCLTDSEWLSKLRQDADAIANQLGWSSIAEKTWMVYQQLLKRDNK